MSKTLPAASDVTKQVDVPAHYTFSPHSRPFVPSTGQLAGDSPSVKLPSGRATFSPLAHEFVPVRRRQMPCEPAARGPEILSSPTPSDAFFASSPSPFASLTASSAAAAIVNIASHAHSSGAELAKRASMSNLGEAASAKATADERPPTHAVNDALSTLHLFSAPVATVTAAIPPSMVQSTFNVAAAAQPSPPTTVTSQCTQPLNSQHTSRFTPNPAPARTHSRHGSTASLNVTTSAFGSPSPPALLGGILKRASIASLRVQPAVPSPLSQISPLIAQTTRSPEVEEEPQHKILAPTPVFGSMSARPSVADLTAAAAAPPFAPSLSLAACGSSMQLNTGAPVGVAAIPSHTLAIDKTVIYETARPYMPVSQASSPAFSWTPATRPKATERQAVPRAISEARHRSAEALAGHDAPPASPVVDVPEWEHAAFDISSLAVSMAERLLDNESRRRQRTFTNAPSPVVPLGASTSAKQAFDSPVQGVSVASAAFAPAQSDTKPLAMGPRSDGSQGVRSLGSFSQTNGLPQQIRTNETVGHPSNVGGIVDDAEDKALRPPSPGGKASLASLVAQLCVGNTDIPIRPTSVVPNIHAGTPDQPVHWTIDDQGKLRVIKTEHEHELELETQSLAALAQSLAAPAQSQSQPQASTSAGPPPQRIRKTGEQAEAFKPYLQNAGPAAQASDRFGMLRKRSMYFAREEGGVRGESPDKDGSPSRGTSLWRKGSGKWRRKDAVEGEE